MVFRACNRYVECEPLLLFDPSPDEVYIYWELEGENIKIGILVVHHDVRSIKHHAFEHCHDLSTC